MESPLLVCTSDATLGRQQTITLAAVAEEQQVGFPPDPGVTILVRRALHSVGVQPRVDLEAIARRRPNLDLLAITDGGWNWTIGALTVAPNAVNPAARALWSMLTPTEHAM